MSFRFYSPLWSFKPLIVTFTYLNPENSVYSLNIYKLETEYLKFKTINSSLKTCTYHFFVLPL